jgi:hypothetical protein
MGKNEYYSGKNDLIRGGSDIVCDWLHDQFISVHFNTYYGKIVTPKVYSSCYGVPPDGLLAWNFSLRLLCLHDNLFILYNFCLCVRCHFYNTITT